MSSIVFDNQVVRVIMKRLSVLILKLIGWRVTGSLPEVAKKCVIAAVPHTTAFDFPLTLMAAFVLDLRIHWAGKDSLFRFPYKRIMLWLGGLPVSQKSSIGFVNLCIEKLRASEGPLQIVIAPEGTRTRGRPWKYGFYHIAEGAQVPIVLAHIDYRSKIINLEKIFYPENGVVQDMEEIMTYYRNL